MFDLVDGISVYTLFFEHLLGFIDNNDVIAIMTYEFDCTMTKIQSLSIR